MVTCQATIGRLDGSRARGSVGVVAQRFIRARNAEQKELRRAHLLETARDLLAGGCELHDLGLNELARTAGVAKANVYRYFESREAVLLELFWTEAEAWWTELAPQLRSRRVLGATIALLVRTLVRRPSLCALLAAVPAVLEQNVSEETIRAFKHRTLAFYRQAAGVFTRSCAELTEGAWMAMLHDVSTVMVGVYPATHPSAPAAAASQDAALGFFRRDFATELERLLLAVAASHATKQVFRTGRA